MQTFSTDDISLASFLLARGAHIAETTSDRFSHFVFVFSDFEQCLDLKREYLNNGQAVARELFMRREELISEMKDRNRDNYGKHN